jgi:hypothetical protein
MTRIPLTGFDRLDYVAWCAFEDFARRESQKPGQ